MLAAAVAGATHGCGRLRLARQFANELRHFNGSQARVVTFVAAFEPGAIDGLFEGVAREDAKNHRHAGVELSELDSACSFRSDVIVMGSFAAQDATDANDGIAAACCREFLRGDADLERSGHMDDFELALRCARMPESVEGAGEKAVCDEAVELADHNSNLESFGAEVASHWFGLETRHLFALKLCRALFQERARPLAHVFCGAGEPEESGFEE